MVTSIQVDERTIALLKKLKEEMEASSYDELINRLVMKCVKSQASMAGSLKKYLKKGETADDILRELQKERRESERF